MNTAKRALSMVIVLAMLFATVATVACVSAFADDAAKDEKPVYLQTFRADNFKEWGSYEEKVGGKMQNVVHKADEVKYNDDGSFQMTSNDYVIGHKAIFNIDAGAKEAFKTAQKIAEDKYKENVEAAKKEAAEKKEAFDQSTVEKVAPSVNINTYLANARSKKDCTVNAQFIVSLVMKDGTVRVISTTWLGYHNTKLVNVPFAYEVENPNDPNKKDTVIMDSIDDVQSIIIEMYQWEKYKLSLVVSGMAVSGTPEMPEAPVFTAKEGEFEADMLSFEKNYRSDYGNAPSEVTYSADGKTYKKTGGGYLKLYSTDLKQNQHQAYFSFDHDKFNYALAVANQEGGSGKATINISLPTSNDQDGKPVKALVGISFEYYGGADPINVVCDWLEPGQSKAYVIDLSKFKQDTIKGVRAFVENYWMYDAKGNVVEKENGGVTQIALKDVEAYFSPIKVIRPDAEIKTDIQKVTTAATTQRKTSAVVEGAGYEFFIMDKESQAVKWGNAPEQVIYNDDANDKINSNITADSKNSRSGKSVTLKSPKKIDKQHQMGWLVASNEEDNNTVISAAKTKQIRERMAQALKYANAPGAPGVIAVDVEVKSAVNPGRNKDCSVQVMIMLHAGDNSIKLMKYQNIGTTVTYYLDVSDITADMVEAWHVAGQNYANTDEKDNACGITNLEVKFSNPYVPGKPPATTQNVTLAANNSEAEEIAALFKKLPGFEMSDYTTAEQYANLEKFVKAYSAASPATQKLLAEKYGITEDMYGKLMFLYMDMEPILGDDVGTGNVAIPVCTVMLAAAAGYIIVKTRKRTAA